MMEEKNDKGVGLASWAVFFVIIAVTLCLVSPKMLRSRQAARTAACVSKLKGLGIALHHYHDAFRHFPMGCGGTDGNGDVHPENGNGYRLSPLVALTPFVEKQSEWEAISNPYPVGDRVLPSMGPSVTFDPAIYKPWSFKIPAFICPEETLKDGNYGVASYVFCYGDGIENVGSADPEQLRGVCRGMFARRHAFSFRDCLDGTSNTIFVSETAIGIGDSLVIGNVAKGTDQISKSPSVVLEMLDAKKPNEYPESVEVWSDGKGSRWADGSFNIRGFNTVLPPNSPSATMGDDPWSGVMSATSHHLDGVLVLMVDGAVYFVSNNIDTGNLGSPSVAMRFKNFGQKSPYGVWGSMGTRASKEIVPGPGDAAYNAPPLLDTPAETSAGNEQLSRIESMLEQLLQRVERIEKKLE